jgi:hypothetical protein
VPYKGLPILDLWIEQFRNNRAIQYKKLVQCGIISYVNTSPPHPAMAVNILGPRSLAGLMAYPQLKPNVMPIKNTIKPMIRGAKPGLGLLPFFFSTQANISATNIAVLKNLLKEICVKLLGFL